MKICILTQPLHNNYGGLLQAYALQTVLTRMGHDVVTDRRGAKKNNLSLMNRLVRFVYHCIRLYILREKQYNPYLYFFTFRNQQRKSALLQIAVNTERFIERHIAHTAFFDNPIQSLQQFDAVVVGSDQVWRRAYSNLPSYFLYFALNHPIQRIAYAASFGLDNIDDYSPQEMKQCSEGAKRFDAISVREDSGVTLCAGQLGVEAVHLLDPTLLLEKEVYLQLIEKEDLDAKEKVMMCYVLDKSPEKQTIINQVAHRLGLTPLEVMPKEKLMAQTKDIANCIYPSVSQWIAGFRDAEFVVTDSFHGTVFAIIFNRPFVAISNAGRGNARFSSLLRLFGLEDRLIASIQELTDSHFHPIDFTLVNKIKAEWQSKSFAFLQKHLAR